MAAPWNSTLFSKLLLLDPCCDLSSSVPIKKQLLRHTRTAGGRLLTPGQRVVIEGRLLTAVDPLTAQPCPCCDGPLACL